MVRLIIADDDVKVRSALELILEQDQHCWQVVSSVNDVPELFDTVQKEKPDLVLLDWELSMGETKGFYEIQNGIQTIKRISPKTRVLVLSSKPQNKITALANGADAFVSKVEPPEVFLSAVYDLCRKFRRTTQSSYPLILRQFAY